MYRRVPVSKETGLSRVLTALCLLHRSREGLEGRTTQQTVKVPTCEVANQLTAEVVTVFSCVGGQSC